MKSAVLKQKQYTVPAEVLVILDKANALFELRDSYVEKLFGFKKARKCAVEASECKREFWVKIYELYPELRGNALVLQNSVITIQDIGANK